MANCNSMCFSVLFTGGSKYTVDLSPSDQVIHLRAGVEKQTETPPACLLKLFQDGQILLDDMAIKDLDCEQPVFGVVVRETKLEVLLQAAGSYEGYRKMLCEAQPAPGDEKTRVVGPMPSILFALEELSGQKMEMKNLELGDAEGQLKFYGDAGDLLMPSLDAAPLCDKAGAKLFDKVTLSVDVNSDAYNRGLGIVLEASARMDNTASEDGLPSYVYNGYGLSKGKKTNAVKFHPGMFSGQIRIEGVGGFGNQSMDFTPTNWTNSGKQFHRLEVTLGKDGANEVCFRGTEGGQVWRKSWNRKLTDGRYIPAIHAWLDLGSRDYHPVHFRQISAVVHLPNDLSSVAAQNPSPLHKREVDGGCDEKVCDVKRLRN